MKHNRKAKGGSTPAHPVSERDITRTAQTYLSLLSRSFSSRLGKIVQEISSILYAKTLKWQKWGKGHPFPVVVHSKSTGRNRFWGERPTCLSWSEAEHSSRQPRRIQANMAAAAGPHLYRRRQRQGQRLLTGGGERRRATATAGEERREKGGKNGKPRRRGDKSRRPFGLR